MIINEINNQDTVKRSSLMTTFSLKQGIKKFGQKGFKAIHGEMLHLCQIKCFKPINIAYYNSIERKIEL